MGVIKSFLIPVIWTCGFFFGIEIYGVADCILLFCELCARQQYFDKDFINN